jgi:localization factor PodJL
MTLGEWLNQVILQDDGPEEVVSESFFSERPSHARPVEPEAPRRLERYEAPEHPGDYVERMAGLLDRLTARIESAEARTGQAVTGVEHSVREALSRIEAAERQHQAVASRIDGAAEQSAVLHSRLTERLRRVEDEVTGPRSTEALRALEGAISKVAGQVYEGEVRARESLAAVEARVEAVEANQPLDASVLIDQVVSRLGERLAPAEGRTADAIEGLRQSFAALDGRQNSVESGVGGGGGGGGGPPPRSRAPARRAAPLAPKRPPARPTVGSTGSSRRSARWPITSAPPRNARPRRSTRWAARS